MLASIHPLGERARNTTFGRTVVFYLSGSLLGGLTTGASLGWIGAALLSGLSAQAVAAIGLTVAVTGLAFDAGGVRLPTWHRQVNEDWLTTYRGWVYGAGFGFQLGMGLVTIVTSAAVYLTFALAFLAGSWQLGAVFGAVFGLTRALPILVASHATTVERLRGLHRRMQELAPLAHRGAVAAQSLVALVAIGVLLWR